MTRTALLALAAAIALPAAASAQPGPAPGEGWRGWPARGPGVRPPHVRPEVRHVRPDRRHFSRFAIGHQLPQFWWGPQFHIPQWQAYGLYQPLPDHRWVRHYDDAYLIDREGYVRDMRGGLDWDAYGGWEQDAGGIPVYVGRGDFHPDGRDHAWVEQHGIRGWDYSEYGTSHSGHGYAAPVRHAGPPPCGPGAGHGCAPAVVRHPGHGYAAPPACGPAVPPGCGYGYGYPMVVTETITYSAPVVTTTYVEEVVEEVVHVRRARVQRRAPAPRPRPARPARPPAGERG